MGSGTRRSNISNVPSGLTTDGVIHCPSSGSVQASVIDRGRVGEIGSLQLQDHGVVLVVDGSTTANVLAGPRLQACLRDGFEYAGVLEIRGDGPAVRFWQT